MNAWNDDEAELSGKLEEGDRIARELVNHMRSLGLASGCEIPVIDQDEIYDVIVKHRVVMPFDETSDGPTDLDEEVAAVSNALEALVRGGAGVEREIAALRSVLTLLRELQRYRDRLNEPGE